MKRSTTLTWDQLRVGALILAALVIVAFAILRLGTAANLFAKRYELITFLPSAGGLVEGGQVTVAGQAVGTIDKIEFLPPDPDTTRNIRIVMALDEEMQSQVRTNSRAKIKTLGLLGDKIIDITPGTPQYRPLRDGDTLLVAPSVDYEALLAQAASAMGDVVVLTHDLRSITTRVARGEGTIGQFITNPEAYDEFNSAMTRASMLMARMGNPRGTFGQLLDDPTLYRNTVRMLASLDTVLVQVNSPNGTLGKLMRDDSLYVSLVGTVAGANSLVQQLNNGGGTVSRLVHDPQLYDQLVKTVTDLNAILADVRRDPRRYTKGLIEFF
jgi:phospholipid/cholesterol/gamma-HCH transport system substrate-binding protein